MKSIRPLHLLAFTLILLSPATPLPGQSPAKTPPAPASRFLLVFNTSSGMSRRAEQMQGGAGNLVASGFKGEIKNGDTIGVWTYNDSLHTGQFPLRRWAAQSRQVIAAELVDFIKQQKFEKRASLVEVVESLTTLTRKSDRLTILIFTDGVEAINGTPFDKEINLALKANESDLRKSKMPFVVVLRSEKGTIIGQTVNVPPWAIEFPKFTPEPEPVVVTPPKPALQEQVVVPSLIISNPPALVESVHANPLQSDQSDTIDTNNRGASSSDWANSNKGTNGKNASQSTGIHHPGGSPTETSVAQPKPHGEINTILAIVSVVSLLLGAAGLIYALRQRHRMKSHTKIFTR